MFGIVELMFSIAELIFNDVKLMFNVAEYSSRILNIDFSYSQIEKGKASYNLLLFTSNASAERKISEN